MMRLKPNSVVIDDAYDRYRNVEAASRNRGDTIKRSVRRRVEDVVSLYGRHSLEFIFGHAVAELGAAGPKAPQLALAQPAPDCLGRRPKPLRYFTQCKKSLFIHGVTVGPFTDA